MNNLIEIKIHCLVDDELLSKFQNELASDNQNVNEKISKAIGWLPNYTLIKTDHSFHWIDKSSIISYPNDMELKSKHLLLKITNL